MQAFRAHPEERMASARYAHLTRNAVAATKAVDHHKPLDRQQMAKDWYRQQQGKSYYEQQNRNHAAHPQHNPVGSLRHRKRNAEQGNPPAEVFNTMIFSRLARLEERQRQ